MKLGKTLTLQQIFCVASLLTHSVVVYPAFPVQEEHTYVRVVDGSEWLPKRMMGETGVKTCVCACMHRRYTV